MEHDETVRPELVRPPKTQGTGRDWFNRQVLGANRKRRRRGRHEDTRFTLTRPKRP